MDTRPLIFSSAWAQPAPPYSLSNLTSDYLVPPPVPRPRALSQERGHPHSAKAIKFTLLLMLVAGALAALFVVAVIYADFESRGKANEINALAAALQRSSRNSFDDSTIVMETFDVQKALLVGLLLVVELVAALYTYVVVTENVPGLLGFAVVLLPLTGLLSLGIAACSIPTVLTALDVYLLVLTGFTFVFVSKLRSKMLANAQSL